MPMQLYSTVIDGVPKFDLTSQSGPNRYPVIGWLLQETLELKNNPPEPGQPWTTATWDEENQWVVVAPVTRTLEEIKELKRQQIRAAAGEAFNNLVFGSEYSPGESVGFATKQREAAAYFEGAPLEELPYLSVLAQKRQETIAQIAAKIAAKQATLFAASAEIEGKRSQLLRLIDQAQSIEEVLEVAW